MELRHIRQNVYNGNYNTISLDQQNIISYSHRTNSIHTRRLKINKLNIEYTLDILIRKISLDPIGLQGQGAIENYIFQVATMSLEVA